MTQFRSDEQARATRRDEPTRLREIVVPLMQRVALPLRILENGSSAELVLGVSAQDDCAAYALSGDMLLVAGSDYVRGPKFLLYELGYLNNYDIGWYLAGANLSDIAAMGAVPLGLLSVIRYPKELVDQEFAAILEGIRDSCAAVGTVNIGGDIGSAERIILSASAFGMVEPGRMLVRSAARPGQVVCLTGATGLAGSAMRLGGNEHARSVVSEATFGELLENWKRVCPRIHHGRIFAKTEAVTACLDTSDGLKAAIETIAGMSGVRIVVDRSAVPLVPAVAEASSALGVDPMDLVFGDSVDFELVATVDQADFADVERKCREEGLELFAIGHIEVGSGVSIIDRGVESASLPGEAWRHGTSEAWR